MSKSVASLILFLVICSAHGQSTAPLLSLRTIPLPGITGKFDHFAFDAPNHRLFAAATGSQAVVAIDLTTDKVSQSLTGIGKPHGLVWVDSTKRLFAADGLRGTLDVYEGTPLRQIKTIMLSQDADDMVYDPETRLLYVGHGGTDSANPAAVAVIDTVTFAVLGDIAVSAHPEGLEIDPRSDRIFVNISDSGTIVVIDGKTHAKSGEWVLKDKKGNTPLAFDAADNLLLVGCRTPAELVALDADTGKEVAAFPSEAGADDLFYDKINHRAYLIAGSGAINSYAIAAGGRLQSMTTIQTLPGAKTALFVPSLGSLFVGVPSTASSEIRVYKTVGR